jgi:hypothetical protein
LDGLIRGGVWTYNCFEDFSQQQTNFIFLDADCGRGFTRIENYCVNISREMAAPNDSPTILSRCQAIQAGQLQAPTQAMLFLLKVNFY